MKIEAFYNWNDDELRESVLRDNELMGEYLDELKQMGTERLANIYNTWAHNVYNGGASTLSQEYEAMNGTPELIYPRNGIEAELKHSRILDVMHGACYDPGDDWFLICDGKLVSFPRANDLHKNVPLEEIASDIMHSPALYAGYIDIK